MQEKPVESAYYYDMHPPAQPKKEIGAYVGGTPLIYDSFRDAWDSGQEFMMRDEHLRAFAGPSGLGRTLLVDTHKRSLLAQMRDEPESKYGIGYRSLFGRNPFIHQAIAQCLAGKISPSEMEKKVFKWTGDKDRWEIYFEMMGYESEKELEKASYSYWEYIPGFNHTIVADSGIQHRWHLMTVNHTLKPQSLGSRPWEEPNGVIYSFPDPITDAIPESPGKLVEWYEEIRNKDRFNPQQCPIVEAQTSIDKGKINRYFLQYHPTQLFKETNFSLKGHPSEDEIEAVFVRGATTLPEGLTMEVAIYENDNRKKFHAPASYDANCVGHHVSELALPEIRKLQILTADTVPNLIDGILATNHVLLSKLFYPEISLVLPLSREFHRKAFEARLNKNPLKCVIQVISDGRRAFVKFLE